MHHCQHYNTPDCWELISKKTVRTPQGIKQKQSLRCTKCGELKRFEQTLAPA